MPVEEKPVHILTRLERQEYGCHNSERPKQGSVFFNFMSRPYVFSGSEECRYDRSLTDHRCAGCRHAGSGELYAEYIRQSAGE